MILLQSNSNWGKTMFFYHPKIFSGEKDLKTKSISTNQIPPWSSGGQMSNPAVPGCGGEPGENLP